MNPFQSVSKIQGSISFPCIFQTVLCHLSEVELQCHVSALKEWMMDDHRVFCLAFVVENVNCSMTKILFSDEIILFPKAGLKIVYQS